MGAARREEAVHNQFIWRAHSTRRLERDDLLTLIRPSHTSPIIYSQIPARQRKMRLVLAARVSVLKYVTVIDIDQCQIHSLATPDLGKYIVSKQEH